MFTHQRVLWVEFGFLVMKISLVSNLGSKFTLEEIPNSRNSDTSEAHWMSSSPFTVYVFHPNLSGRDTFQWLSAFNTLDCLSFESGHKGQFDTCHLFFRNSACQMMCSGTVSLGWLRYYRAAELISFFYWMAWTLTVLLCSTIVCH